MMEGLIILFIFFVMVLLLCVYLMSIMKIDLKYLEKKINIKLKYLNTLYIGLQTEVTDHRAREHTLDVQGDVNLHRFLDLPRGER